MANTGLGKVAITPKGDYNELTQHTVLDAVRYEGSSWIVLQNCTGGVV